MTGIVHATTVHARGDTRIAIREAASLTTRFGEVALFVQDGLGPGTGPGGVRVVDTGPPPASRPLRMSLGVWRMARAVAAARPRIAHIHDPELIPAALWWRLCGIRVIYDAHEDLPRQIVSKPYLPRALRGPVARLAAVAERIAAASCDGIVAATPGIAAHFPKARTALVRNFPDLGEIAFGAGTASGGRQPQVLYVGAITEIRGARTMVEAMSRVRTPGARLVLAGAFRPPELARELAALPGWDRVDFAGWADRDEVARLLSRSRLGLVLFHPEPNHLEAQPNKLFEYMAAGLPIIASDFPNWRALFGEVGCAVFVDPRDPAAMAEAIEGLLENPRAADEMGTRGRRAVEDRFNWAREAETLAALYRRIGGNRLEEP